ncbi:MAG: nuclear transport factor 2 family protein [Kiloniellales bacterium]|nr:nuclear transport factor 2 family protein [Kiloniellales bacterium]
MSNQKNIETLRAAWDALGRGDWDALTAAYTDDMIFVIPGQNDIISGKPGFRAALENIAEALPPGFDITDLRYFTGETDGEVVNVVEWTSTKIPEGTQSAILWKFDTTGQITEERWYVDTEQWKAAF